MLQLKQLIGSIISSYLGPYKSNKLVVEAKDTCMIKCPVLLLQKIDIKDHLSYLIEETLNSHHEQYGCSSISLLTMWYLWNEEFHIALQEGCEITDIVEHSQNILELVISHLSDIAILCDETFLGRQDKNNKSLQIQNSESSFCLSRRHPFDKSSEKSGISQNSSNKIPIGVQYSSRHFSPSQSHYTVGEQEGLVHKTDEEIYENNCHEKYSQTETLKCSMKSLVEKLSHGAAEFTDLIYNAWTNQVETSNSVKFNIDGIVICPVTLPSSYSTVVDGLIFKSNVRYLHDQDLNIEKSRALIIKGSIAFEYAHLGYSEDVCVTLKKSPEELEVSAKDGWIRKCCDLLLDFEINCLFLTGEVDPAISSFCSSNSIFLLPCISWTLLQDLCVSVNESPCVYLLECDHENVISNLTIKKWDFEHVEMRDEDFYVHITISNPEEAKKIYTIVLCHPNQLLLTSQEHQFWHMASRLHLATKGNKLLPGGGKTEKWCFDFLQKCPARNDTRERIKLAIQRGFLNYFEILLEKTDCSNEICTEESVDEMQSKIQAWRSAMALVLVLLQCDCLIVNGCDDPIFDQNLIGLL
ncbi:Bardet-Biedl syndrome 12 [Araneus ventricosus]|uniref:Bardet-Biedl syndrome 12 n=1 Tax=Araneus ventricosus TaxID=182803 RepID=A0A4Y2AP08_ARAVE|nr:Bardet-Biedl syndrome 12 [Araneus ventricosus]